MKKNLILALIVTIGLSVITGYFVKQSNDNNEFNFVYQYWVEGSPRNILDTYNDTYQKFTVEGVKTIRLMLTKEEKKQIYHKMKELDFFNIPSSFPKKLSIQPNGIHYLKINIDGKEKILYWSTENFDVSICENEDESSVKESEKNGDNSVLEVRQVTSCNNNDPRLIKAADLGQFIQKIIDAKEMVKELPKSPAFS